MRKNHTSVHCHDKLISRNSPSSRSRTLLLRTKARARDIICLREYGYRCCGRRYQKPYLCPRDKFAPPASMWVSRVNVRPIRVWLDAIDCASSLGALVRSEVEVVRDADSVFKPVERKASFNVASSCSEKGSRFSLKVPANSWCEIVNE